jgi:putative transposase
MPNHVHVMIEPLPGHEIGRIVGAWKSVTARKILGSTIEKRHLWQVDYFDRFIRNERHYRAAVNYIHQNPVKGGLVGKAEDWPWRSARMRSGLDEGP